MKSEITGLVEDTASIFIYEVKTCLVKETDKKLAL